MVFYFIPIPFLHLLFGFVFFFLNARLNSACILFTFDHSKLMGEAINEDSGGPHSAFMQWTDVTWEKSPVTDAMAGEDQLYRCTYHGILWKRAFVNHLVITISTALTHPDHRAAAGQLGLCRIFIQRVIFVSLGCQYPVTFQQPKNYLFLGLFMNRESVKYICMV